jgi:hypothetical protein
MTTAQLNKLNKSISSFFGDEVIAGSDFTANVSLWKNKGEVIEFPAIISPTTSENAIVDWKLNVNSDEHGHYIHVGKKFGQVQDLFDAEVTDLQVKIVLQEPRPLADTKETVDYVMGIENGAKTIKSYKDAITKGAVRVMLVMLP